MIEQSGLIFDKFGDRRFRSSEEAIFDMFSRVDTRINLKIVKKRAGISSSTFYRHHKSINSLLYDYEKMIMNCFRRFMRVGYKGADLRQIVRRMLIFIILNKKMIKAVAKKDNYLIIYCMVRTLKRKIEVDGYLIDKDNKIFDIYVCEVCGVIKGWQEDGYTEQALMKIEDDIAYLTLTINERLGKLVH